MVTQGRAPGLAPGDRHIIGNAGGVVTDDTIRSLGISRREVGRRPTWAVGAFTDIDQDVRQSMPRVRTSPFLTHTDDVRGFVFDVHTGLLREITNK